MENKDNNHRTFSKKIFNKAFFENAKKEIIEIKKKLNTKSKYIYLIIIASIFAVISCAMLISIYINNSQYKRYTKYEDKMKIYGFDQLYNNKSANSSDTITVAEALKLVIAATYNVSDISGFATVHNEYDNATWVEYAKYVGITNQDINVSNYTSSVKYIDVLNYFENAKLKLLKNTDVKDVQTKLSDLSKYTTDQQVVIKDMIANGIITIYGNKLNGNTDIYKGKLNEIVVNFVEKYNTITILGEKINVNPDKIPTNAQDYPYTLSDVDKTVYEIPNYVSSPDTMKLPVNLYSYKKEEYYRIDDIVNTYFNTILNVDYQNLDRATFMYNIDRVSLYPIAPSKYNAYFDYVVSNKIKITGSSKVQFPAIYYDGNMYRARTKITFQVLSADKYENLLFYDLTAFLPIKYQIGKTDLIIDLPLARFFDAPELAVYVQRVTDSIAGKVNENPNQGLNITVTEPVVEGGPK